MFNLGIPRVAVIGTAGRGKPVSKAMWNLMVQKAHTQILQWDLHNQSECCELISGGAAVADHVAVSLHLKNKWPLWLCLPAPWDKAQVQFKEFGPRSTGSIANFYHRKWGGTIMLPGEPNCTLRSLGSLMDSPLVKKDIGTGFHERNLIIARNCTHMIAFTWGEGNEPMDGGTKHTWDHTPSSVIKLHIPLSSLE